MSRRPLAEAMMAVSILLPQVIEEVLYAEHGDEPRAKRMRRLDTAIAKTKEVAARLEAAQLLYAASSADREPIDSAAWTGRGPAE